MDIVHIHAWGLVDPMLVSCELELAPSSGESRAGEKAAKEGSTAWLKLEQEGAQEHTSNPLQAAAVNNGKDTLLRHFPNFLPFYYPG